MQVSCGCKKDCGTTRCSCRKAGITCTRMCKVCNGDSCINASKTASNPQENDFDYSSDDENSDQSDNDETENYTNVN